MPEYRVQTGDMFSGGVWSQGSYDMPIDAADLQSAKSEADRRLEDHEIQGADLGEDVRVIGPDGSKSRRVDGGKW